jgi:hypothetical protein
MSVPRRQQPYDPGDDQVDDREPTESYQDEELDLVRELSGDPDVLLDVPLLKVDEIHVEVDDLQARVSLQAEVLDLLKLNVGADVLLGKVELDIKGVEAQALLKVRLDRVAAIVGRVLTTIDRNPQILERLTAGLGEAAGEIGHGARTAVGEVGRGARTAVGEVGRGARTAVGEVGRGARTAVGDVGRGAGTAAGEVGRGARTAVGEVSQGTGEAVREVGRGAGRSVDELGRGAGQSVDQIGRGTGTAARDAGRFAASAVEEVPDDEGGVRPRRTTRARDRYNEPYDKDHDDTNDGRDGDRLGRRRRPREERKSQGRPP